MMPDPEEQSRLLAPSQEALSNVTIFPLLRSIKADVEVAIDSALTWEQLNAPEINFTIVRPLYFKYAKVRNMAVVYACLIVRSHFLATAEQDLAFSNIKYTRASLCELMAIKTLRHFATNPMEMVAVLTTAWSPLQGAPQHVIDEIKNDIGDHHLGRPNSALEVAISSESKHLLSSPLVQTVINNIWNGLVFFQATSRRSLIHDNYKRKEIAFYDPFAAPFLDHYRLRVPKYRAILEFLDFAILLVLFMLALSNKSYGVMKWTEIVFIVFAFGFILDEFAATQEHGWLIYAANIWNGFDMAFILIFLVYFGLRIKGLVHHDDSASDLAFDILACAGCVLFPRLAFFSISNNVIILALQGMISEFVFFMFIASICFSGLLFTLHELADGWPLKKIAWLLVQVWFGNTSLSFATAESFHPLFGPILMVMFAALSNTLLLTILISILSNKFALIQQHATQEFLFQYAISTLEGVKSDAIFSYQPPFNILAYVILTFLTPIVSPRTLHTINVFMIRLTSFPVLIVIGLYERNFLRGMRFADTRRDATNAFFNSLPRGIKNLALIEALAGPKPYELLDAVFEVEVDDEDLFVPDEQEDVFSVNGNTTQVPYLRGRLDSVVSTRDRPSLRARSTSRNKGSSSEAIGRGSAPPPSPLAPRVYVAGAAAVVDDDTAAAVKRMEKMMQGIANVPLQSLQNELKDLQERQARIENLLYALTRQARGESTDSAMSY